MPLICQRFATLMSPRILPSRSCDQEDPSMTRTREYDPLACMPSADITRRRLRDAERIAERLRILLEVCERIEAAEAPPPTEAPRQAPGGRGHD